MKRILRIIFQDNFRLLVIVMMSFFIGSNAVMLGNGLMNNKDARTIQNKSQLATDFGISVEQGNIEPRVFIKDSFETGKALEFADEISTVTFFVFNQEGLAVPDATIELSDGSFAMTDEFGFASFALFEDAYLAEISKPQYEALTLDFIVEGDDLFLEVLLVEILTEPLQMICPPDVSAPANDLCYVIDLDLSEPLIIDFSPGYVVSNDAPADGFPLGTTEVTWTVENEWGESVSCTQLVTVIDEEPPTISPVPDISIDNEAGQCGSSASWDPPTASDNCEGVSLEGSHAPGDFFPVGSTSVIYTATDVHGNAAYAGFTVEVIDVEPPTLSTVNDIVMNVDPGQCSAIVEYDFPVVTENCPGVVLSLEEGLASGSAFPVGTTTVRVRAVDDAGNVADSFFSVTVNDNEPPNLSPVPDITADSDAGACGGGVSWDLPLVSDNCEVESLESSHAPGDFFPAGSTPVIYTATDVHGNAAYSGFTVEVIDVEPPTFSSVDDIVVNVDPGQCSAIVEYDFPAVTENCSNVVLTLEEGLVSGSDFPVGITTLHTRATDHAGNVSDAIFSVTVNDNELPIISPLPDITAESGAGACGGSVSWDSPTASDNCEVESLESSHAPGDFFPAGSTPVIYTATDVHGNPSYAGFTVEVIDVEPPTIEPIPDITIDSDAGECGGIASWDQPTSSDNCEGEALESSHEPGDFFPVGSTPVMYTATDVHGNPSYAGFTVEVIDVEPPTVNPLPEFTVQLDASGNASIAASDLDDGSFDACGIAGLSVSPSTFTCTDVGPNTVTLSATDSNGNTNFGTATVMVQESEICLDCEGVVNGNAVPGTICFVGDDIGVYNADCICEISSMGSLSGEVEGLSNCVERNITIEIYNYEFPDLSEAFTTTVDESGEFTTPAFSTGTYDILITVEGYLSKLYPAVDINPGSNSLNVAGIVVGDLDASNGVNIVDVSIMSAAFGTQSGDLSYNVLADLNCDGGVNIIDVSILNVSFGMVGDNPPSE